MHSSLPRITFSLSVLCALASQCSSLQANQTLQHAITLYGEPKYPAHFSHFDYTNPLAPKGGELKQAAIGSYDSFKPLYRQRHRRRRFSPAARNLVNTSLG